MAKCDPQIMSMANMKDSERLELLKEIGGTKVYEERRRESLRIMQETENRRAQVGPPRLRAAHACVTAAPAIACIVAACSSVGHP